MIVLAAIEVTDKVSGRTGDVVASNFVAALKTLARCFKLYSCKDLTRD